MVKAETASLADFARLAGLKRSHVTRLKVSGRLVLADDGVAVRVAESLARIEATRNTPPAPWPETATLAEFAAIAERKPSYLTELKASGRLVMTHDGKRVRVAESLAMIEATRDPSKAGVVARHAAARQAGEGEGAAPVRGGAPGATGGASDADAEDGDTAGDSDDLATAGYQDSRAMRERYLAKSAKRDYLVSIGKLLDADEVTAAVAAAATNLRTRFESLPDVLGPQLAAARDESAARAILAEAIEHALEEASRQFAAVARSPS